MTQFVIDFESVVVDVKDETAAREIASRMIKSGDVRIDVVLELGD